MLYSVDSQDHSTLSTISAPSQHLHHIREFTSSSRISGPTWRIRCMLAFSELLYSLTAPSVSPDTR